MQEFHQKKAEDMNHELKQKLNSITQELDVTSHVVKIAELKTQHTHSISAVPSEFDEPLEDYNCVMFALDLVARLENPCSPLGRFYADTEFLSVLIAKEILKVAANEMGKIIVWSDEEKIKHVGLVSGKDVAKSKWGIGNLTEINMYAKSLEQQLFSWQRLVHKAHFIFGALMVIVGKYMVYTHKRRIVDKERDARYKAFFL